MEFSFSYWDNKYRFPGVTCFARVNWQAWPSLAMQLILVRPHPSPLPQERETGSAAPGVLTV